MINHLARQLALRQRLLTLVAASTSGADLAASGHEITRDTGSFLADGYGAGMEVVLAGFGPPADGLAVITRVTASELTVDRDLGIVASGAGRTVSVGLPGVMIWQNSEISEEDDEDDELSPTPGRPYGVEQYVPGPAWQATMGEGGEIEGLPQYVVQFHVPEKSGVIAAHAYAGAALLLFPPRQSLDLGPGDFFRVRSDIAPSAGQLMPARPGWAVITVTVPLRVRTPNTI